MSLTPHRVQRKRTKGWKMPPNTVYVGRPSKWGNPWRVGFIQCSCRTTAECAHNLFCCDSRAHAVEMYRHWVLNGNLRRELVKYELRGKHLACWCPLDQPCHADVLLAVANDREMQ